MSKEIVMMPGYIDIARNVWDIWEFAMHIHVWDVDKKELVYHCLYIQIDVSCKGPIAGA